MDRILEYNGYYGSIDVSIEDGCLHGKLLFITDTVTYEAQKVPELEAEFRAAVDDYIKTCADIGKEPLRPFKGSFNVRVSPELHRQAAVCAQKCGITMNELVSKAIDQFVNKPDIQPINIEHHDHHHEHHHYPDQRITGYFEEIGENNWTQTSQVTMCTSH